MLPEKLAIGDLFAESDAKRWEAAAARALGVDDPRARLTRQNSDGIAVAGLYDEATASGRDATVARANAWSVIQEHAAPTDWIAAVREAGRGGVDGHLLRLENPSAEVDWSRLLASAEGSNWFDAELRAPAWEQVDRRLKASDTGVRGCLGLDPVTWCAMDRDRLPRFEEEVQRAVTLARTLPTSSSGLRAFAVDTSWAHRAGASGAQEVALALAAGLRYAQAMESAGMEVEAASGQILFRLRVDARFFESMVKCRALRQLWSQLLRTGGIERPILRLFARQSERAQSALDPWVNALRATASVFGGALGGADYVAALRYDDRLSEKDPAAQRLARNTALILREESHLARVEDPAAGAYAIESLTHEVARAAYGLLQQMTARGSIEEVLASRWFDDRVATVRQERRARVRRRQEPRTGVSEFALVGETMAALGTELEDWRIDGDFEELRLATDVYRAHKGSAPQLAIARVGRPAEFHSRQLWIENLLAAGGIRAQLLEAVMTPEELVAASAAAPVLLCAGDERLESEGAAAVRTLRARGYSDVWVAGRAAPDLLEEAGCRGRVHVGVDVVEWLGRLHRELGVEL